MLSRPSQMFPDNHRAQSVSLAASVFRRRPKQTFPRYRFRSCHLTIARDCLFKRIKGSLGSHDVWLQTDASGFCKTRASYCAVGADWEREWGKKSPSKMKQKLLLVDFWRPLVRAAQAN